MTENTTTIGRDGLRWWEYLEAALLVAIGTAAVFGPLWWWLG